METLLWVFSLIFPKHLIRLIMKFFLSKLHHYGPSRIHTRSTFISDIYINDLANVCNYTMPIFFAADSNLFQNGKDQEEMKINSDLAEIAEWLKVNILTLNLNKTICMIFSKRHNNADVSIKLEGKLITRVSQTKFLGLIIDDKLNWKAHISYISGKISRAIGVIIKARNLGKDALLSLYYTLIFPYLTYCNQVWGSTFKYNINTLNKLQKRAIRIICSA